MIGRMTIVEKSSLRRGGFHFILALGARHVVHSAHREYDMGMKNPRGAATLFAVIACLLQPALPASAKSFAQVLSSFPQISLPFTVDEQVSEFPFFGDTGPQGPEVSISHVETYILIPAKSLAASRVGLRPLEEWASRIRHFRGAVSSDSPYSHNLKFTAIGQVKSGGFVLLIMSCYESLTDNSEGPGNVSEAWLSKYVFSFTTSGRLIDGIPVFKPDNSDAAPSVLPEDPVYHQGLPGLMSFNFYSPAHITIVDRYMMNQNPMEIEKRETGLSSDGTFKTPPPTRRFFLSKVFHESSEPFWKLFMYEELKSANQGNPLFLVYQSATYYPSIMGEAAAGMKPDRSIEARGDSGRLFMVVLSTDGGSATLTDTEGKKHALELKFGPGQNREETVLVDRLQLGDRHWPIYRSISYLFAPTLFVVNGTEPREGRNTLPGTETALFDAHTYTLGNLHEGYEEKIGEWISMGTLVKETSWTLDGNLIQLEARSVRNFEDSAILGTLAADAVIDLGEGKTTLPAGTPLSINEKAGHSWAIPSRDIQIIMHNLPILVPAGSTIRFQDISLSNIVFSKPVLLRVGAAAFSAFYAGFWSGYISEAALVNPVSVSVGGKTVAFINTLTFDEGGNVTSGRLQADTALTVAGKTVRFHGGYDPENPEAGMIHFNANGRVRSGFLSAAADFQIGKSRVRLLAGDSVTFRQDGSVEACTPSTGVTVSVGGRQVSFKGGYELIVNPDGSIASGTLAQGTKFNVGGTAITFLGDYISFYPSGAVKSGKIGETIARVGRLEVKLNGGTKFFENGIPTEGVPLSPGAKVGANTFSFRYVKFDSLSRVVYGELSSPIDLLMGGRHFVFDFSISFYEDGSVKEGRPSSASPPPTFMIDGKPYTERLVTVGFYPDGGVTSAQPTQDWSRIYVYRSKTGEEQAFLFNVSGNNDLQLQQDVPFMVAGEGLWAPKGTKTSIGFLTGPSGSESALLSRDLIFMGHSIGQAGEQVSRADLEKRIMEIKGKE
jgi:hypothetical protein